MSINAKMFEINLNTVISSVTLLSTIALAGYVWANTTRDIDDVKRWQSDHDRVTAERLIENRTVRGQYDERIKSLENVQASSDRNQDQVTYRVTVLETATATQAVQQQRITEVMSDVQGDMKLVKELLQRMEAANKRAVR